MKSLNAKLQAHLRGALLASIALSTQFVVASLPSFAAQSPALPGSATATTPSRPVPALPGTKTPADTFRELLALSPADRAPALADRTEHQRKYLETRLREYDALPPVQRQARLRQLDLTYHLDVLMKLTPDKRTARLADVPPDLRPIVDERLRQWDQLPGHVQQEVLEHETTANYFLRVRSGEVNGSKVPTPPPGDAAPPSDRSHKSPPALSQFFDLPAKEQQRTLEVLPAAEREQMENALKAFASLPREQRQICINSFEKLNQMTPSQRDEFLKSAARWKAMSPAERETWRALVDMLPPQPAVQLPPPLPPGAEPVSGPATASNLSPVFRSSK